MNLVLAVEPDSGQAELLRRLVPRLDDIELMLVDSAEAVAATLSSRVPRLLLLGASLSEQSRALAVDHYILASDAIDPPVLAIPALSNGETTSRGRTRRRPKATGGDVEAFTAAIVSCLAPQPPLAEPLTGPDAGEDVRLEIDSLADAEPPIDPAAHAAALKTMQELAEARLTAEVERVRREADELHAAEIGRLRAETEARGAAEIGRLRAEAEARVAAAVRDAQARTLDEARTAEAAAVDQAISRVRAEAAEQLAAQLAEVDLLRSATEQRMQAELRRTREETAAAADALIAETEERHEAALAAHQSAIEQARAEAERDSRERSEQAARAEAARVESEGRLKAELDSAHQDLHRVRQAMEQLRAHAERDSRERAAEARRADMARIDLEGRHRAELEGAHQELTGVRLAMEQARAAHHSAIEQARADAERESRVWAEEAISTAAARLTADADARIAFEVAAVRTEAEQRRVAGLVALRTQLDHLTGNVRDAGIDESVVPPATAVAVEAAAVSEPEPEPEVSRAAQPMLRQVADLAVRGGRLAARGLRLGGHTALPVARRIVERVPARAAAVLLLVVGGLALVDVSALTQRGTSAALSASRKAVSLLGIGGAAHASDADAATDAAADATADEAAVADGEAAPVTSGLLQVYSRVPLDLYISGKRIGASGEREIVLPPGRHRVEFVSERLNYRGEATVTIRSSAFTTHNVVLPMGSLLIDTEPGAEIIIEGEPAGVAPVGVVSAPLGTCEIVVRHPEHGERREVVEVRHGVTTELRVAFPPGNRQVANAVPPA